MGKSERVKGQVGERQVCNVFNDGFADGGFDDLHAERNLEEYRGGSFDVRICAGEDMLGYAVQVKFYKSGQGLLRAMREADAAAEELGEDWCPVAVSKENIGGRREWIAALPLWLFSRIMSKAHGYDTLT